MQSQLMTIQTSRSSRISACLLIYSKQHLAEWLTEGLLLVGLQYSDVQKENQRHKRRGRRSSLYSSGAISEVRNALHQS